MRWPNRTSSSKSPQWRDLVAACFPEVEIVIDHTNGFDFDQDRYATQFNGKTWCQIPINVVSKSTAALSTLSPDAASRLLPAYLPAAVDSYDVAWALLLNLDPEHSNRAQAIVGYLSAEQRALVLRILEISCDGDEDQEALERVRKLMAEV